MAYAREAGVTAWSLTSAARVSAGVARYSRPRSLVEALGMEPSSALPVMKRASSEAR